MFVILVFSISVKTMLVIFYIFLSSESRKKVSVFMHFTAKTSLVQTCCLWTMEKNSLRYDQNKSGN